MTGVVDDKGADVLSLQLLVAGLPCHEAAMAAQQVSALGIERYAEARGGPYYVEGSQTDLGGHGLEGVLLGCIGLVVDGYYS